MKIAVAGTGYVGLSLATLLSQKNNVTAVDIIPEKVEKINKRVSPIQDKEIEEFFAEKKLNLKAALDPEEAYKDAEYVIIAAPTNYDSQKNYFDTELWKPVKIHKSKKKGSDFFYLKPGQTVITHIADKITIPKDCAGKIEIKSAYARLSLSITTGDFCNPGCLLFQYEVSAGGASVPGPFRK